LCVCVVCVSEKHVEDQRVFSQHMNRPGNSRLARSLGHPLPVLLHCHHKLGPTAQIEKESIESMCRAVVNAVESHAFKLKLAIHLEGFGARIIVNPCELVRHTRLVHLGFGVWVQTKGSGLRV